MGKLTGNQPQKLKEFLQSNYNWNADEASKFIQGGENTFQKLQRGSSNLFTNNPLSSVGNTMTNLANSAVDVGSSMFYNQLERSTNGINMGMLSTALKGVSKDLGDLTSLQFGKLLGDLFDQASSAAANFLGNVSRTQADLIGVTAGSGAYIGELAGKMQKELYEAMAMTRSIGMTSDDFIKGVTELVESSGRMAMYNKEAIQQSVLASIAYTKSSDYLLKSNENFRNVGYGLQDAAKVIEKAGKSTLELGLNAKVLTDTLVKNIEKLNQYGFKDGVQGLTRMAQEAQSLNFNIDNTFKIADQLFDPAKALEMSANLSLLGGAMGDFGDPLRLIYDTTNNIGGLQTGLINAAKGLATFDEKAGTFVVTSANLRRAKMMADTFGISMQDLTNLAVKANVNFAAMGQINMFKGLTDSQKEFVKNLATMKGGQVGFNLPDDVAEQIGLKKEQLDEGFISANKLSDKQIEGLVKIEKEIQNTSTADIARKQFNAETQILSVVSGMYILAQARYRYEGAGKTINDANQRLADSLKGLNIKGDLKTLLNTALVSATRGLGLSPETTEKVTDTVNSLHDKIMGNKSIIPEAKSRLLSSTPDNQQSLKQIADNTKKNIEQKTMPSTQKLELDHVVTIKGGSDAVKEVTRHLERNKDNIKMLGIQTAYNSRSFDEVQKIQPK